MIQNAARRADYGIDAPYVPIWLGGSGVALLLAAALLGVLVDSDLASMAAIIGLLLLLSTASYLYTTRVGKFVVWTDLLRSLGLRGDERVLDIGCGRGAKLILVARQLPRGRAVGVDLWSSSDQSGNTMDTTRRNAEREGVAERIDLHIADMRELPFEDNSFDVVVSSLAIHNIEDPAGRSAAIDQAWRTLKPGGRLLIADIRATDEYARERGAAAALPRDLGWRFWYGGPWVATRLVSAMKPT